ncbi:MAG TPA: hypothetical protein VIV60_22360, partial [Polyangiaceae bacterium]
TSEASALATESAAAVGPTPLHVLRSLLQAVADRCHEGGAETTERLLGHRRSVLAMYEPALAHVPATGSLTPVIPLGAEASRQRLFKYLAETLGEFAQEHPLMWVIDDLGWADELSLAFLHSLSREYLDTHPLFILCTFRTEEPSAGIAAIAEQAHVVQVTLPRLSHDAIHSMIGDMLALRESLDGFSEFVARQAEGNPFFVAEYLRTAVAERILYRDQRNSWKLVSRSHERTRDDETIRDYEALSLPRSLLALIEQRLRQLSPAAYQAVLAAAVLGREAELETLLEVAALSDETSTGAIDELMRRHVLEQPVLSRLRFVHDKLREVTYAQASSDKVRQLHARAAAAIESRCRNHSDASQQWATLGHHFAAAKDAEHAAHYLKLAADHARATYANSDAIRLYEEAIKQVSQILSPSENDPQQWQEMMLYLYEALGDVLDVAGRRGEARTAYREALARTSVVKTTSLARLYRKTGKTWETDRQDKDALRFYDLARDVLGPDSANGSSEQRHEWIQVHLEQLYGHYFLDRVPEMDSIIGRLHPVVAEYGSSSQRAAFFQCQMMLNMRRDRYNVTDATLGFARAGVDACGDGAGVAEFPMAQFGLGFALLFHHSFELAGDQLRAALALSERAGNTALQARCLTYLALTARMQGQIAEAETFTDRSLQVASAAETREYFAAALANRAWLSLRRRDPDAVIKHAQQALAIWRGPGLVFPFQWMALLPLMKAALARGDTDSAVACADSLEAPGQQRLPSEAADSLARATAKWNERDAKGTIAALELALIQLGKTGYG